ncbi:MAG: prolyl oligopeptidase family serine peptidase [Clostridia bacterium]|nr:prolyl oligopeptidase family serine peptidase [Clostridia bacterium]
MIRYESIKTHKSLGEAARRAYFEDILRVVKEAEDHAKTKRDQFITPALLAADREGYREKFAGMLGWPLTTYVCGSVPNAVKELVEENEDLRIYRISVEALPNFWFRGLIYEPKQREERVPLVVMNPGGGYCAEEQIANGDYAADQLKNIGGRLLEEGIAVYAPQLLLWSDGTDFYKQPEMRQLFDAKLKAVGGSMAALEIYCLRRAIDYFVNEAPIDPSRIGMMGLSYGGFYTLYAAAAETRVKSVFSSCFFCDRFVSETESAGCRYDWLWQNSANTFFDAEVAALIAPRALYIENGEKDTLFPIDMSLCELERLTPYYEAQNASERLLYHRHEGGHEIGAGNIGYRFFVDSLLK